jgi:hypothetical protein
MCTIAWPIQAWPSLELKTWPRFCPVSLSLSTAQMKKIGCRKVGCADGATFGAVSSFTAAATN